MKIVALVKQVPDTWGDRKLDSMSGRLTRRAGEAVIDEINERAMEIALQQRDLGSTEVVALTMGPANAKDVLRKALAMGADSAIHILDEQLIGADLLETAATLAAAIFKLGADLVIAGNESTDGRGGIIPAMIAELLGLPHLTYLKSVEISADRVFGERVDEHGEFGLASPLPAVISVTETSAEPRFPSFKGIMGAKKKPLEIWSLADLSLIPKVRTAINLVTERPARIAGIKIVDEGDAGEKLADFLATGHLI